MPSGPHSCSLPLIVPPHPSFVVSRPSLVLPTPHHAFKHSWPLLMIPDPHSCSPPLVVLPHLSFVLPAVVRAPHLTYAHPPTLPLMLLLLMLLRKDISGIWSRPREILTYHSLKLFQRQWFDVQLSVPPPHYLPFIQPRLPICARFASVRPCLPRRRCCSCCSSCSCRAGCNCVSCCCHRRCAYVHPLSCLHLGSCVLACTCLPSVHDTLL